MSLTVNVTNPTGSQTLNAAGGGIYFGTSGDADLMVLGLDSNGDYRLQIYGLDGNNYELPADGDESVPEGAYTDGTTDATVV